VVKNGASGRDPALRGFCKCSHIREYAALPKTPHALADGLMLVFRHPVKRTIRISNGHEPQSRMHIAYGFVFI
jgi:hypothetical protein